MKLLVLCPHVDDELLCAATIAKKAAVGHKVTVIALASCEQSLLPQFTKQNIIQEFHNSCATLGVMDRKVLRFPVRQFPKHRQKILEYFIKLRQELTPDTVFLPSRNDVHQDHQTVNREGIRAFRNSSIWGYEFPFNMLKVETNIFVNVEKHIKTKVRAMHCYCSQEHRSYINEEVLYGLSRLRGSQVGYRHAEAFEAIRIKEA